MNKRLQIKLSAEAEQILNKLYAEAKSDFKVGTIKISDLVSEIIIHTKIDIKALRAKYTDLKKSLVDLANNKNIDLDLVMKTLSELKARNAKKSTKQINMLDGAE